VTLWVALPNRPQHLGYPPSYERVKTTHLVWLFLVYTNYMITVYSTPICAYCKQVKQYLDKKGRAYTEVDLEQHPDKRQELYEATGAMTVPITEVDGEFVVGYNLGKLSSLL